MTIRKPYLVITGISGFIGSYVARHFLAHNWSVVGVDRLLPGKTIRSQLQSFYQLQLPDKALKRVFIKQPIKLCIHCAGPNSVGLSIRDPEIDFYMGTVLTFEILNTIRLFASNCHFIFLSSAAVYGNPKSIPINESHRVAPVSPYGFHKLQCEEICHEFFKTYDIPVAIVRIFSAYGNGLKRQVMWDICKKALTNDELILEGTGEESRDFIHAVDIAHALESIASSAPMNCEVYNIGTGERVRIKKLAEIIIKELGKKQKPRFNNILPQWNPRNWQADISKISRFGFHPKVSLQEGIQAFIHWCKAELQKR